MQKASAQLFYTQWEYGIVGGASQYFGDLNDNYGFKTIFPVAGIFARYHANPYIALRATASYTRIGYDDKFTNNTYSLTRNLNFKSNIFELSGQAEFNFFRFSTGEDDSRFTPYLTLGIGAFYYNPYTTYKNQREDLRPLGTEGQNAGFADRKYGNVGVCFPIGAGIKYWLASGVNFGLELSNRLTLNDYLDDVSQTYVGSSSFQPGTVAFALQDRSLEVENTAIGRPGKQRGNASSKDQYMYLMFTLSFQFKTYKCPSYQNANYKFEVY